jgi:hypothetical protein
MLYSGTDPESIKHILVYEDNVLEGPRKTSSSRPTTRSSSRLGSDGVAVSYERGTPAL